MASNRPIKLDAWGISWEEYKELSYFCLQYEQKKRDAAALLTLRISTPAPALYHTRDGAERGVYLPHGGGRTGDPTAAAAAKRERILHDVRMIEQAAKLAGVLKDGTSIYSALLQAVTTRSGVVAALGNLSAPCNKNEFYDARRKFFWVLRELKNGDMEPI
jgi:hypothetical protein